MFWIDFESIDQISFNSPEEWKIDENFSWKPYNSRWSSPLLESSKSSDIQSAWLIRAREYGDAIEHSRVLVYEREVVNSLLIGSLQDALNFAPSADAFYKNCIEASVSGVDVIDFSWNVVFEAEIAALNGDLGDHHFPTGLGTESSLWLSLPIID